MLIECLKQVTSTCTCFPKATVYNNGNVHTYVSLNVCTCKGENYTWILLDISHHVHRHVTFEKNKGQCYTIRYCEHNYSQEILNKNIHRIHKCVFWKQRTKLLEYCMMTAVEDTSEWSRDGSVAVRSEDFHGDIQRVEVFGEQSYDFGRNLMLVASLHSL